MVVDYDPTDLPQRVLDDLSSGITSDGTPYTKTRRQPRSVRVTTSKAVMDVVPLIEPYGEGGTLYIPDRKASEWLVTNPPGHTQWTTDVNKSASGRFKPLVKLFKWWRRENPTVSSDPKGFMLECLVSADMSMTEPHYGELFVGTAEAIVGRYKAHAESDTVPFVQDPGVPRQSVMTGVTAAAFRGFVSKLEAHAEKGREALSEEGAPAATKMWRELFGPRFPDLGGGKGAVSGPIPVPPPTFPDRPVRPKKPGGFASALVL